MARRWPAVDISCILNAMSAFKLPTTGDALAYAAREYVDHAYGEVKNDLEWTYLPQGLLAIWDYSPLLKEARKASPQPIAEIREICHIIVTFPGDAAVRRIRELLIQSHLVPNSEGQLERADEIAIELFNLTMRYTRVQNLARHIRTAVNSHLKAIGIETSRDRSRGSSLYESSMMRQNEDEFIRVRMNQLRDMKLKNEMDVDEWADAVNNLLSLTSSGGTMTTARLERAKYQQSTISSGATNSYKLRFKQALASTLGIDLSNKDVSIEKTSNKSIEGLLRELENLPSDHKSLYQMLENLRPKRSLRSDTLLASRDSSKKNLQKHVLNIAGRELIIEGSSGAFTAEMVAGVLKTFGLQLSIDPDAKELSAAFESRGQVLRVQIELPKKSDQRKLSEILDLLL
ncbi:hypothetical protein MCEPAE42_00493 [Candidatus Nanopelagicaceae bacterium]